MKFKIVSTVKYLTVETIFFDFYCKKNMEFEEYKSEISADIKKVISTMGVQPILFVGSGLSKRYFNGPSWETLLVAMASLCPNLEKEFAYYKQNHASLIDVGSTFSEAFREWAWSMGREIFPDILFDSSQPTSIYSALRNNKAQ